MDLNQLIVTVPDFPIKGVLFRDINPIFKNAQACHFVAEKFLNYLNVNKVDYFAGIESRGFILAMLLAAKSNKGFIPIRKAGKLPAPTIKESYNLEYGSATIEMNSGSGNVVIVDDVLATGGTLRAAINITGKAGYHIEDVVVFINLVGLNSLTYNHKKIFSLLEY